MNIPIFIKNAKSERNRNILNRKKKHMHKYIILIIKERNKEKKSKNYIIFINFLTFSFVIQFNTNLQVKRKGGETFFLIFILSHVREQKRDYYYKIQKQKLCYKSEERF